MDGFFVLKMKKQQFQPVPAQMDFPAMERDLLRAWYESGLVEKYLHKNDKSKKKFSFLDGPITANNPMGVHHAWGRTYKDLFQRYHNMKGEKQRFQNGFDCQGLWVEVEVEKELGFKTKKDIELYGVAEFVNRCKERVLKYSSIQTEQSKRLGYFMDWENSYFTMSEENNYTIWNFLKVCFERGWIYKGHESVPWCPRCETAISQHEMLTEDYKELTHKSIYMRFPIVDRDKEYLLVWTTTPWTIPANIAVAVDENFDYVLAEDEKGDKYWLVKQSKDRLMGEARVTREAKGKDLTGLKYRGAFDNLEVVKKAAENPKFHTVVATDPLLMPITTTEGTGMVHTAVSAGEEDFRLGKKLGLPMIPVIADNADYLPTLEYLAGRNAKKHPEIVLDLMTERGFAWQIEDYTHRYPACWRCKTELVWKVADEWYIAMDEADPTDKKKRTLREQLMAVAQKITWLPAFGLDRELDWLKNMHDWLISKPNRYWGLALPIYECKKCGHFEVVGSKEELHQRAVEGWEKFEDHSPHKPWVDEVKIKCSKCGETVSRIPDVGNPWLDAGIVSFSTLDYLHNRKYWEEWFPADFITESFPGQFKNWFYSLITMSTVLEKTNPMKTVLGFGTMLDTQGRPFHKSLGNAIEFVEGADKFGADIIRWFCESGNPANNIYFDANVATEVKRKFYLMLWNVYAFFITYARLDNWQPKKTVSKNVLDRWILARLNETIELNTMGLDKYDAMTPAKATEDFVNDLSTWYLRRSRDRRDDEFYGTTYEVLVTLSKLLAPFMPFVTEEIYHNLTSNKSVHLENWPKAGKVDKKLLEEMATVRKIAELTHAQRKAANIRLRQPLAKFEIRNLKFELNEELVELLKEETNVKNVVQTLGKGELNVELDTKLTPELEAAGTARDLVREIQEARKAAGTSLDEKVVVYLPDWPKEYTDYISRETLATKLVKGNELRIERV
ncbi:isoleucine--tRNA ligase [Patescibacteria group bacterium]|nr:isoleucine--tRNA ligase [Patescibacteria group bacterium]